MLTFEQAFEFTQMVGSHTSFEDQESRAYFAILMTLPEGSRIAEIGLQFGRSSSIALQVALERGLKYIGIDPFTDEYGQRAMPLWNQMAKQIGADYSLFQANSCNFPIYCELAAILIDGDHSEEQVYSDCERFLPHVTHFAFLHDYQRESNPEIEAAAKRYFGQHPEWSYLGIVCTLGIWKRI